MSRTSFKLNTKLPRLIILPLRLSSKLKKNKLKQIKRPLTPSRLNSPPSIASSKLIFQLSNQTRKQTKLLKLLRLKRSKLWKPNKVKNQLILEPYKDKWRLLRVKKPNWKLNKLSFSILYKKKLLLLKRMRLRSTIWRVSMLRPSLITKKLWLITKPPRSWLLLSKASNLRSMLNWRLYQVTKRLIKVPFLLLLPNRVKTNWLIPLTRPKFPSWLLTNKLINPMKLLTKKLRLPPLMPSNHSRVSKAQTRRTLHPTLER